MPRPLRIDYPGAVHHVTARTNRREPRFRCQSCRGAIFDAIREASSRFQTRFLAYAVMETHLHLAVESPDGRLARTMQLLIASITRRINLHHGHEGHVFRGRYFNRTVEAEEYARYLLAYIHLNPVAAGVPHRLHDPSWTSHAWYLSEGQPDWLHTDTMLLLMGGRESYRHFVDEARVGKLRPPVGFDEHVLLRPRSSDQMALPEPGVADTPAIDTLLGAAEAVLGALPKGPMRGRETGIRDVAILWMLRQGATQNALGHALDVDASTISRASRRAQERLREDRRLHRLSGTLPDLRP